MELAKKFKESPEVIHAIEAHHGDVEAKTVVACLVQAADAVSAARPGARRENLENYIKRLEKLESIATSFEGVEKSYAIQAGREIRIILKPEVISDDQMVIVAREIAKKIEEKLAKGTSGFTGADLENLLNEAALLAGRRDEKAITMADLQQSVIKVIAGPEKHSRVIPEHERRLTAYHEAGHAVVMHTLPDLDPVHQITIVPRGQAGGMTIFLPDEDRSYLSRTHLLNSIAGLLGGRAAEQLVLGDISTGASNDISRATQLARKMVGTYGMSEQLGNVAFDAGHDEVFIGKSMAQTRPYSEKTAAEMDGEIRRIMDDAYARCTAILEQYRPQLVEVAEYLLANETMTAEEFEKVFRTE